MALKHKIDKATFDKLSDALKAEYIEKDGEYVLDVEGFESLEDTGALRRGKERESQARKEAERKLRELEERMAEIESNGNISDAKKAGDIEKLQKQWDEKFAKLSKESGETINALRQRITGSMAKSEIERLAAELSDSPKLLIPHIASRIQADFGDDGEPVLKFIGADGQLSDAGYDGLKKEFLANKDFAAILRGNQSRGAGGKQGDGKNGRVGQFDATKNEPINFATASPKDVAAAIAAKREAQSGNQ